MASSSGRPTVADVVAQQGHLEGRITGLERDMQNMSQAVASLTETVSGGFRDTREIMAGASRRQDQRTSELHARLDKSAEQSAEHGRWKPGLLIAAITCAVLVGGVLIAFVQMTTAPLAKDDIETRQTVERHISLDGHADALQKHAETRYALDDHQRELVKLHTVTDGLITRLIDHAKLDGYTEARVEAIEAALDVKTGDRFLGREGAAHDARIRALESRSLQQATPHR